MHNFFNPQADEIFLGDAANCCTVGIATPQVQIFKNSCGQINLMHKVNPLQIGFNVIPTGAAVRTPQQPAVFDRKTGLQLKLERDAALAVQPVFTAVPVLPAVLKALENGPAEILLQQL